MKFKKNFSQNFLINKYYLNNILNFIKPEIKLIILEIGFGKGVLSKRLLLKFFNYNILIFFVELDYSFYLKFKNFYKFNIFNIDILKFNLYFIKKFTYFNFKLNLIGNLPYKIITLLLINFIKYLKIINNQFFLLENKYFLKIINNNNYLSIILNCFYKIKNKFLLNNLSFFPKPSIKSNFINFQPLYLTLINLDDFYNFKNFIKKLLVKNKYKIFKIIKFDKFNKYIYNKNINNYILKFFIYKKLNL